MVSAYFPVAYGNGDVAPNVLAQPYRCFCSTMLERQSCVDCGVQSPETDTNYTLISGAGWRLTREKLPDGRMSADWHCPRCWNERKGGASSEARIPARPAASPLSKTRPGF